MPRSQGIVRRVGLELPHAEEGAGRLFQPRLVLALAGYTKSLKSEVASTLASRYGFLHLELSDPLVQHLHQVPAEVTVENLVHAAKALRAAQGEDILGRLAVERLGQDQRDLVVVAGLRSVHDHRYFKSQFMNYRAVFMHSPRALRFERLRDDRSVTIKTEKALAALDAHHLSEGLADVAADCDFVLVDDPSYPVGVYGQIPCLLSRVAPFLSLEGSGDARERLDGSAPTASLGPDTNSST